MKKVVDRNQDWEYSFPRQPTPTVNTLILAAISPELIKIADSVCAVLVASAFLFFAYKITR